MGIPVSFDGIRKVVASKLSLKTILYKEEQTTIVADKFSQEVLHSFYPLGLSILFVIAV